MEPTPPLPLPAPSSQPLPTYTRCFLSLSPEPGPVGLFLPGSVDSGPHPTKWAVFFPMFANLAFLGGGEVGPPRKEGQHPLCGTLPGPLPISAAPPAPA